MIRHTKKFLEITTPEREDETLNLVHEYIAAGGSIIDWCDLNSVHFWEMSCWLNDNKSGRFKRYAEALKAQNEWVIQKILSELKDIALFDRTLIFDEDNNPLPVSKWPIKARKLLEGVEVKELYDKEGNEIGKKTQYKLAGKLKSIENMMKNLGLFTDRTINLEIGPDDKDFRNKFFNLD